MKFHLGYYMPTKGPTTYHYSKNESSALCGLKGGTMIGWEGNAWPPLRQLERFKAMKGRKHKRRYCKTCLRLLKNARDAITRLAEIVE